MVRILWPLAILGVVHPHVIVAVQAALLIHRRIRSRDVRVPFSQIVIIMHWSFGASCASALQLVSHYRLLLLASVLGIDT